MQAPLHIPVWKSAPFVRLLFPLVAGIILQWKLQFSLEFILLCGLMFFLAFVIFYFIVHAWRYRFFWIQGMAMQCLIFCFAMFLTMKADSRIDKNWFGHFYQADDYLQLCIQEPLEEKANSYKATANVELVIRSDTAVRTKGKIIIYFAKTNSALSLKYGDQLLINRRAQPIRSSGNPGAFDYKQYAAFQQIFYTVYLRESDYVLLTTKHKNVFRDFLLRTRAGIVEILQKNLPADKNIVGIAEALLIGYKVDLDKDLLQAYSNTGVVHIIAISGLHLGLIYVMLVWLFDRIPGIKRSAIAKVCFILCFLWLFSLLTGASASVLRSAVMFTCIVIGKSFFKQSSIYNSLAASAVMLLCFNPYLLWDVGFQLSYLAVLGIVWLQMPISRLLYFKTKALRYVWAMIAVTIAAQIAAFPICIFYFHQFPNMFLFTNIITVPLSEIILIAEIFLILLSWNSFLATYIGKLVAFFIECMNAVVNYFNSFSFSVYENIYATAWGTLLLYAFIICLGSFWLNKNRRWAFSALIFLAGFCGLHAHAYLQLQQQSAIIVYNVSKYRAMDIVDRNKFLFLGDSVLMEEGSLQNFHLKPSRIAMQLNHRVDSMAAVYRQEDFWQIKNKTLLWVDSSFWPENYIDKKVDLMIFSNNPNVELRQLVEKFHPTHIIFDGSNSLWKIAAWKSDCEELHLPCFSVSEKGAFVLQLDN